MNQHGDGSKNNILDSSFDLAAQGSLAALTAGMILYALDGVLFAWFGMYMPSLFHVFVLYQMGRGWMARRELARLRAESPTLTTAEGGAPGI